jgi:nucleotide-binding universal stress UspA family protein
MNATYTAITSRLGIHIDSTSHTTQRAAEMAARRAIKNGTADSAAIYVKDNSPYGSTAINYFGTGR